MTISMGIDIVEIEEIKTSIKRSKRFVERVYTPDEIAYCEGKSNKYQHYAARFAAKEAVMKALGTGWDKGVQWGQVEVVSEVFGNRCSVIGGEEVNGEQLTVNSEDDNQYSVISNQYTKSPMPNAQYQIPSAKCPVPNTQSLVPNPTGKPEIKLSGVAMKRAEEMGVDNILVSLSHSRYYAVASVIFEGDRRRGRGEQLTVNSEEGNQYSVVSGGEIDSKQLTVNGEEGKRYSVISPPNPKYLMPNA